MIFYLFGVLIVASRHSNSEIIHVKYQRYFVDKIVNLGKTNVVADVSFRSCAFMCERTEQCAGFHFEKKYQRNAATIKTACKLQIVKEGEFPKAFFSKANSSYYAKSQNPLKAKDAIGCDPIDSSLTYYCSKEPSSRQPFISCQIEYGNQSVCYKIQTSIKVRSSAAHFTCISLFPNSSVARITDKRIQDWLCNMVTAFRGTTRRAFTIGLYKESSSAHWRYGSASHDLGPTPENFYQNWYFGSHGIDDGQSVCVQMLSGAPYNFKWKVTPCDNGTIAHPLCEIRSTTGC